MCIHYSYSHDDHIWKKKSEKRLLSILTYSDERCEDCLEKTPEQESVPVDDSAQLMFIRKKVTKRRAFNHQNFLLKLCFIAYRYGFKHTVTFTVCATLLHVLLSQRRYLNISHSDFSYITPWYSQHMLYCISLCAGYKTGDHETKKAEEEKCTLIRSTCWKCSRPCYTDNYSADMLILTLLHHKTMEHYTVLTLWPEYSQCLPQTVVTQWQPKFNLLEKRP